MDRVAHSRSTARAGMIRYRGTQTLRCKAGWKAGARQQGTAEAGCEAGGVRQPAVCCVLGASISAEPDQRCRA